MEPQQPNSPFRGSNSFSRHLRITKCFNDFLGELGRHIFVLIKFYPQTQEPNVRCIVGASSIPARRAAAPAPPQNKAERGLCVAASRRAPPTPALQSHTSPDSTFLLE